MNKRIKELIEECTDRHFSECVGGFETFDKEKFAELIVRECAELIDNKVLITAAQTYDEVFVAVYDTNFANSKRIREHFGVEE